MKVEELLVDEGWSAVLSRVGEPRPVEVVAHAEGSAGEAPWLAILRCDDDSGFCAYASCCRHGWGCVEECCARCRRAVERRSPSVARLWADCFAVGGGDARIVLYGQFMRWHARACAERFLRFLDGDRRGWREYRWGDVLDKKVSDCVAWADEEEVLVARAETFDRDRPAHVRVGCGGYAPVTRVHDLLDEDAPLLAAARAHPAGVIAKRRLTVAEEVERFGCWDCRLRGEPGVGEEYMVRDAVWRRACMRRSEFLCLRHLEERIQRPLVREDFTDAPINERVVRERFGT